MVSVVPSLELALLLFMVVLGGVLEGVCVCNSYEKRHFFLGL